MIKKNEFKKTQFAKKCASFLFNIISDIIKSKGSVSIALSGGKTPFPILKKLIKYEVDWSKVSFYLVDERDVDFDSDESNYYNLNKFFFLKIKVSTFPMKNSKSIKKSVYNYSKFLRNAFENNLPSFDLILLGMGNDGHIASLFPNSKALTENLKWVVENYVDKLNSNRITLTFPVILNSKNIILITQGKEKSNLINNCNDNNLPIYKLLNHKSVSWLYSE